MEWSKAGSESKDGLTDRLRLSLLLSIDRSTTGDWRILGNMTFSDLSSPEGSVHHGRRKMLCMTSRNVQMLIPSGSSAERRTSRLEFGLRRERYGVRRRCATAKCARTTVANCSRRLRERGKEKKVGTQGNDKKEVWWKSPKIKVEKREGVMLRNTRQLLQAKAKRVTNPGRCD